MTLNELDILKQKADLMGISYKANIGIEALRNKVNAKLAGTEDRTDDNGNEIPDAAEVPVPKKLSKEEQEQAIRDDMYTNQMALVRVRISCLNPAKAQIKGEIITVANRYLGTVRKFVPFGEATDNGYHIPRVLLNELKSRKFNSISTKKGPNGQLLPVQRLVPEFAIEELEQLSLGELDKLAAAQMAADGG